jgi:hypothetical protein
MRALFGRLWMAALCWGAGVAVCAQDIALGDPLDKVRATLGPPSGSMACGSYMLLCYERGRVELTGGKVSSFDLVSAEVAEARRRERLQREEEQRVALERERVRQLVEGSSLRLEKLADAAFMASPAEDRVAFWRTFRTTYPLVPLGPEYTQALQEMQVDLDRRRAEVEQNAYVASLERRVRHAEERAEDAEEKARRSRSVWYDGGWGYYPVVPVRYHTAACPPPYRPHPPVCVEKTASSSPSWGFTIRAGSADCATLTPVPVVTRSPLRSVACSARPAAHGPFAGPARRWP